MNQKVFSRLKMVHLLRKGLTRAKSFINIATWPTVDLCNVKNKGQAAKLQSGGIRTRKLSLGAD